MGTGATCAPRAEERHEQLGDQERYHEGDDRAPSSPTKRPTGTPLVTLNPRQAGQLG